MKRTLELRQKVALGLRDKIMKWDQRLTYLLRLKVMSEFYYKIFDKKVGQSTLQRYIRLTLGNYVITPCK